jgi:succinate dehydrogenase/fumarate reductase cytochrome b subunit
MQLRSLHRASAFVLIAYAALHIGNHLVALQSVEAHIAVMNKLRVVYQQPIVETLLLFCVFFQAGSGLRLLVRGRVARAGRVARLQALSGTYLAFFLVVHVGAVLYGRLALGLDTNFYFAAAGFHVQPYEWFFAPYYTLAVFSLFAHLGCALYWRFHEGEPRRAKTLLGSSLAAGSVVCLAISLSLAGKFQPVNVPDAYKSIYDAK